MLRPGALRTIDRCFLITVLLVIASVLPAAAQRCESSASQQIVDGIYDRIKADKDLAAQISHINVVAAYFDPNDNTFSVKFQGWADNGNDHDKVRDFGTSAACVRSVNINLFLDKPPGPDSLFRSSSGCAAGTKPCGDVCIPAGDSCGISATEGAFGALPRLDNILDSRLMTARSVGF